VIFKTPEEKIAVALLAIVILVMASGFVFLFTVGLPIP
jgi:hypothetical protein